MKVSIIEYIINKINETNDAINLEEIVDEIGYENYNFHSKEEMVAIIYTDLMVDGRFLMVDNKWDLQNKYTMNEIRKHRSMQLGTTISNYLNEDGEVIDDFLEEESVLVHSTDDDTEVLATDESLSDFLAIEELETIEELEN